jgi:hypothetical protein
MSNKLNDIWLEDRIEQGYSALLERDFETAEIVVADLKDKGFESEARKLEADLLLDKEISDAEDKGSEDGVDLLQDRD